MKHTKIITALLSIVTVLIFTSISVAAVKKPNKTTFTKQTYTKSQKQRTQTVRTKEYRVPGAAAVGYAKQHGYKFRAVDKREKNATERRMRCKFIGSHWQIGRDENCTLMAFYNFRADGKCSNLRKGWKIKDVQISGSYTWDQWEGRPVNTPKAKFKFRSVNKSRPSYSVSIKTITLIGPEGPANKWQEAFNHCSDASYRP